MNDERLANDLLRPIHVRGRAEFALEPVPVEGPRST
ncbi:MAG: hypothetical protein JWR11_3441 [Mycobacterium sp.]|jgi:hypothetical protein|nr:hypothetical protein [Mycobacterium sp.]